MVVFRWRHIIKIIICVLYLLIIFIIANRIFYVVKRPDSTRNPKLISVQSDYPLNPLSNTGNFLVKQEEGRYEQRISQYERNIIPGLGEDGEPAFLYGEDLVKGEKSLAAKAMNVYLSDKISLFRRLPDFRDPLCANITYDKSLPSASVVIIFYNEPWSVLLRTVHSVLRGSPPNLLQEIILVDDHSDEDELQGMLTYYVASRLPKKVKLLRLNKRLGLIRARLAGARDSTGDVLVFLDAHCEVIKDWLSPLLQRIKEKRNAVLMPIIDNISEETLEYMHDNDPSFFQVGGFTWSGHFTWINIQKSELKSRPSPISPTKSPTMAGGLFAINRKYFWEIGSYDDQMDGWGGENLEMSFRIWQCGGSLETLPCSRVGHIFRNFHPYKFPNDKDTHGINTARLVYVWMDEYKRLFLLHRSEFKNNSDLVGDIKERMKLRKRLKCKSFRWYLKNIYPEKFIPDEDARAYGRLKLKKRALCLDNLQHDDDKPYNLGVYGCHKKIYPSQFFSLSNSGELRREETCARVIENESLEGYQNVQMSDCDSHPSGKEWILSKDGGLIHVETGLCLDATGLQSGENVRALPCIYKQDQLWQFDFYNKSKQNR